jgi:MoxR-like ATPase
MAAIDVAMNKLRPSLVATAITSLRPTGVSLYVHGAPGIAKSAVARQVADKLGIAFIDIRLSQMAPEDVRGVPIMGEIHGVKGVFWSPPLFFPRDLDYQQSDPVIGSKPIRFFNPLGNNGIHYCTAPEIAVTVAPPLHVTVTDRRLDRFTVTLHDAAGRPAEGLVTWSVTGPAEAILALEEFNSAPPSVMAASYQLVLDRRLGDYLVPIGVMLLAMGNRDTDRGVTYKLPKPVANRFIHLEMVVDFDDWITWATQQMLHPDVIGYLSRWPSKLLDFQPDSPLHSFATPRSWEFVSKIISQPLVTEVAGPLICGAIGSAIGTEFLLHREFMSDMPDAQSILDGTTTTFQPKNRQHATQIAYSTAVQMLYRLKDQDGKVRQKYPNRPAEDRSVERKDWRQCANRMVGYMMDFFPPEVTVVALRMAMTTYGLRFTGDMPRYAEFNKVNHDLFF